MAKRKGGASRAMSSEMSKEMLLLKKLNRRESLGEKLADLLTNYFGTVTFLFFNLALFAAWLVINFGHVKGIAPFDPFPFQFLTMSVSLEAIALAVIVLISQNRASKLANLREQMDVEIDLKTFEDLERAMKTLVSIDERLARLEKTTERREYPRGSRAF